MPYTEDNRYLYLTTPAGKDVLLLRSFTGQEAISRLFTYQLSLWAENATVINFAKLIGDRVSFGIEGTQPPARDLHGTVIDFSQGDRGAEFTEYQMTVVPDIWMLTRRFTSRIFQHITMPDILKKVFTGFNVAYEIQGTFQPREYCTQYQESDFNFASRLMEEEGIYYYFKFTRGAHKLVVSNSPQHPQIPGESQILYEPIGGGAENEERIYSWRKVQTWGSGKLTVWDHHFQLPHKKLEADKPVLETVTAGKVQHKLHLGGNENLEIYENPGRYAQRFDGIEKSGGEKAADLQKIFDDNKRTVLIRTQEVETPMLLIYGQSDHRQLTPGHKFTLQRHFNADDDYMVLEVSHTAIEGSFRSGEDRGVNHYENTFTCLPDTVSYRPRRVTERPAMSGPASAVVVGPPGEEIFTDKYSRVKVQFHWDREGKLNADSSCWLRVTTPWAGRNWGMVQIPRVGQEVIVDFLEGDPDRPIIIGSVYNADQMPPYKLPDNRMISGWKSNSTPGGGGYNEISMNDTKSSELVNVHAQKDMTTTVEHDDTQTIHNNRAIKVDGTHNEVITKDTNITIEKGPYKLDVQNNTHTHHVKSDVTETYDANQQTQVAQNILTQSINAMITIDAKTEILLHCGDSMMSLKQDGTIVISGKNISILGSATVKAGVGNQNMVCDVQQVATSGAAISSTAVGMHTIAGAVVKIN